MRWIALSVLLLSSCAGTSEGELELPAEESAGQERQEVHTYRACDFAPPGQLVPLTRAVPAEMEPLAASIGELLGGVNRSERDRGCRSFFSARTENMLGSVSQSEGGDTVFVDFLDFSGAIPEAAGARSFLPPGVMAELTWTIFRQFPDIDAVHFSFAGDSRAFWSWVAGGEAEPRAFTREMWERI